MFPVTKLNAEIRASTVHSTVKITQMMGGHSLQLFTFVPEPSVYPSGKNLTSYIDFINLLLVRLSCWCFSELQFAVRLSQGSHNPPSDPEWPVPAKMAHIRIRSLRHQYHPFYCPFSDYNINFPHKIFASTSFMSLYSLPTAQ